MSQLKLPGLEEYERQWDAERVAAREKEHEEWAAGLLKWHVKDYPPSVEECDLMISGIRIDRFVSHLECEKCNLATRDHTMGFMFMYWSDTYRQYIPIKLCLKDFYRKFPRLAKAMSNQ